MEFGEIREKMGIPGSRKEFAEGVAEKAREFMEKRIPAAGETAKDARRDDERSMLVNGLHMLFGKRPGDAMLDGTMRAIAIDRCKEIGVKRPSISTKFSDHGGRLTIMLPLDKAPLFMSRYGIEDEGIRNEIRKGFEEAAKSGADPEKRKIPVVLETRLESSMMRGDPDFPEMSSGIRMTQAVFSVGAGKADPVDVFRGERYHAGSSKDLRREMMGKTRDHEVAALISGNADLGSRKLGSALNAGRGARFLNSVKKCAMYGAAGYGVFNAAIYGMRAVVATMANTSIEYIRVSNPVLNAMVADSLPQLAITTGAISAIGGYVANRLGKNPIVKGVARMFGGSKDEAAETALASVRFAEGGQRQRDGAPRGADAKAFAGMRA